jgi:hypothetical protein
MTNFATVEDIELVIQTPIVGADKIASAEFALLMVSAAVRNYTRQQIDLVADDEITLDSVGGKFIFLPELPVVGVAEVFENGILLVATTDYGLTQYGILARVGRPWLRGLQYVAVKYTHGYAVIPDDIRGVTARAASRLYQAGLRAAESDGVLGVVSKSLGDFAVTFGGESNSEGTLGASGARLLILSEKDLLDKYRV